MNDRVPTNPGRVLITPENGAAAYYATMTRADNPTQEGTPLNKATLLKDATAALYGLDSEAVPDDVLKKMSAAALAENNPIIDYSVSTSSAELNDVNALGPGKTFTQMPEVGGDGNYVTSEYSFQVTGAAYSSGEYPDFQATSRETCWAYRAKHNNEYFFVPDADPKTVYYVSDASGVWDGSTDCFFELGTASKDVIGVGTQVDRWSLKTTLGDDIVVGAQIATGSYVGTGTKGPSGASSLVLPFAPKMVIVGNVLFLTQGIGGKYLGYYNGYVSNIVTTSEGDKTITWYVNNITTTNYEKYQCNTAGETYNYIALG